MLTRTPVRNRLQSIVVSDPPSATLIDVAEAKKYLNVTIGTGDDALITRLISAAVATVGLKTRRALLTQEVTTIWKATNLPLRIWRSPIQNLVSVRTIYQGEEADVETLSNFYIIAGSGLRPKIAFKDGFEFTESDIEEIEIVTSCGFGDEKDDVPEKLIQAAYLILNQFYDHRDNFVEGSVNFVPFDAENLIYEFTAPVI